MSDMKIEGDLMDIVKRIEDLLEKLPEGEFDKLAMGLTVVILNSIDPDRRIEFLKDAFKILKKAERLKKLKEGTNYIMERITKNVIDDVRKGYIGQDEIPFVLRERLKSEGITSKIHMEVHQIKKGKRTIKVVDTDEGD